MGFFSTRAEGVQCMSRGPRNEPGVACAKCGADDWRLDDGKYRCKPCRIRAGREYRRNTLTGPLTVWRSARKRAKKTGRDFEISVVDVERVWPRDNLCPILGTRLAVGAMRDRNNSPSLDRIRSDKGYVVGNIAVISFRANQIKSDATVDEVQRVALWMNTAVHTGST